MFRHKVELTHQKMSLVALESAWIKFGPLTLKNKFSISLMLHAMEKSTMTAMTAIQKDHQMDLSSNL